MQREKRMRIGIALGGGGAKGFAHIGILKAFSEAGIRFDVVTGTSIGALVGALYSADALKELEAWSTNIRLRDVPGLLSPTWSPNGMFTGDSAFDRIVELLATENIEDLAIPFAAISTDLQAAKKITHRSGSIRTAIRASSAIPAVFTSVQFEGRTLIDGGFSDNLPVQTAREMGADYVVAVDLFGNWPESTERNSDLAELDEHFFPTSISRTKKYMTGWFGRSRNSAAKVEVKTPNMLNITMDTLSVISRQQTESRLEKWPADLLMQPPVSDVGILDFHSGTGVVDLGYQLAKSLIHEIPAEESVLDIAA